MTKQISSLKQSVSNAFKVKTTKEGFKKFFGISLYRNAIYLILDGAIPAISGFLFWVVAARIYSSATIGIASAAIAANGLLVALSLFGLNNTLIRFLPSAREHAWEMINSSFTICGLVAVIMAFIFILGLGFWSPALISIRNNLIFFSMFVVFVLVSLFDTLSGIIYVANRRSDLILFQDIIASVLRFIPLFLLATVSVDNAIFASWGSAILVATLIGIFIFIPITQNGFKPRLSINKIILGKMLHYSATNYFVSLLAMASNSILPLIVLNILGAEKNAYFYISWTISSTIASVPSAITTSLFAEGANDEDILRNHVRRSIILISFLLIPLIAIILIFGKWLLLIFGAKYSENATIILRILTICALPLTVNSLYFTIKRIQKAMKSVVILTSLISAISVALSWILLPRIGLVGAGIGWLVANGITALFIVITWIKKKSLL